MAINSVLKISAEMQEIWCKFPKLKNNFHLRAIDGAVSIVSNNEYLPMRGIKVSISKLESTLKKLSELHEINKSNLFKIGFKDRNCKDEEALVQVRLINNLQTDEELKKVFNAKEITFIGSELILKEGRQGTRYVPDIVVLIDDKICFIEVKKEKSKDDADTQVKGYIENYGKMPEYFMLINNYLKPYKKQVNFGSTPMYGISIYGYKPNQKISEVAPNVFKYE